MCIAFLGGLASAAGSIYSGMTQAAGFKAQAQGKRYEADAASQSGSFESQQQENKNARLTGQQITAAASNGVSIAGTPGDVIVDSRTEGEMDKQAIRYNYQFKSNLADYEAKVAKVNAKSAKTGGIIGAIAPILSGIQSSFGG